MSQPTEVEKRLIPQFEPHLGEEELAEVQDCIRVNWLTEGAKCAEFVRQLREYTGAKHVLLVPNGTLALYVALKVAGIGPGDEVIVPDFTFFASGSSVVLTGAKPVFVDVDARTLNLDPGQMLRAFSRRTKAVMPVHIYGQAADMDSILKMAREHGVLVVEDAAQGMGVRYNGRHVGTFGDMGCLSFFADKTITTGEGGAIFTDDDRLAERCLYFKNQGRLERGSFVHPFMGYNFRLTDLQAAIGIAQMRRVDHIIARKRQVEAAYQRYLAEIPQVSFLQPAARSNRVPFRIGIFVPDAPRLAAHLGNAGVQTRGFFRPLHRQPSFTPENSRFLPGIANSVHASEHGICLPSSVRLREEDIRYVCTQIETFLARC